MNFGIYVHPSKNCIYNDSIQQAVYADQLGFDSVWLTEKHFDQGHLLWSSPLITASYIAAKTKNIKIGFAACVSTFHHPVRLAEDFANLDVLSNGRLIVGLTHSSLSKLAHEVFQAPPKSTKEKFNEQFEIITGLWKNELDCYSGNFYKIPKINLYPLMIQKPLPPIFCIAGSNQTIINAARKGAGIFLNAFLDIAAIKEKKQLYQEHFIDALGIGPQVVLSRFIYVGTSADNAITDIQGPFMEFIEEHSPHIKSTLQKQYGTNIDFNFFNQLGIFGDRTACTEKIKSIASETGINNFILLFNLITLEHEKSLRSMERFSQCFNDLPTNPIRQPATCNV